MEPRSLGSMRLAKTLDQQRHRCHVSGTLKRAQRLAPQSPQWTPAPVTPPSSARSRPVSATISECRRRFVDPASARGELGRPLGSARAARIARAERAKRPLSAASAATTVTTQAPSLPATPRSMNAPAAPATAPAPNISAIPEHTRTLLRLCHPQADFGDEDHALLRHLASGYAAAPEDYEEVVQQDIRHLRTGHDAIAFFAKYGDQSEVKVLYCRHSPSDKCDSPYELEVVNENKRGNDFYMISSKGVVRVCPGQPSEHVSLVHWMHETMMYSMLMHIAFFRRYLESKILRVWKLSARREAYITTRARLCKRLMYAKPAYAEPLQRITNVIRNMCALKRPSAEGGSRSIELSSFIAQQKALVALPELDAHMTETKELVNGVLDEMISAKRVDEDVPTTNRTIPRFVHLRRQEAEFRAYKRQLRLFNISLFKDFIWLVDVMLQSSLVTLVIRQTSELLEHLQKPPKYFTLTASFSENGDLNFEPTGAHIQSEFDHLIEHFKGVVASVAPLASSRKYEKYLENECPTSAAIVVASDRTFQTVIAGITERLLADMNKVETVSQQQLGPYRTMHLFLANHGVGEEQLQEDQVAFLGEQMAMLSRFEDDLEKLKPQHICGSLVVENRTLRTSLAPILETVFASTKLSYKKLLREKCEHACDVFKHALHELHARPTKLEPFVQFIEVVRRLEGEQEELMSKRNAVDEMFVVIRQYRVRLDVDTDILRERLLELSGELVNTALPAAAIYVHDGVEQNDDEIDRRARLLEAELMTISSALKTTETAKPGSPQSVGATLHQLTETRGRLEEIHKSVECLNRCLNLLGKPRKTLLGVVKRTTEDCDRQHVMWEFARKFVEMLALWKTRRLFGNSELDLLGQLETELRVLDAELANLEAEANSTSGRVGATAEALRAQIDLWLGTPGRIVHLRHLGNPDISFELRSETHTQVCADVPFERLTIEELETLGFFDNEALLQHHAEVSQTASTYREGLATRISITSAAALVRYEDASILALPEAKGEEEEAEAAAPASSGVAEEGVNAAAAAAGRRGTRLATGRNASKGSNGSMRLGSNRNASKGGRSRSPRDVGRG
eukprot:TRINITY_DN2973_c0_g1_i1.p1 TRINITY_DN2973_c0_g1~~TRINITY_DN2973_c0_g1_i1.p1  ORF type:complete len:1183 (+),score=180.22 TRINITY_DN2973_c0_g1_i1:298-3549(+)